MKTKSKMLLSEAILKGCQMHPRQSFECYDDNDGGTCVLQAAGEAVGIDPAVEDQFQRYFAYFFTADIDMTCPACGRTETELRDEILIHLNDDHRVSREAIAKWVAGIEAQLLIEDDGKKVA